MSNIAIWGDFEIHFDDVLGRGGMGTVYTAVQRSLSRNVAVKVLHADRVPDPELIEGFLEKFQVEIRALSRLQDARIVTIIQAGKNDGNFWFAMELIEGRTVEKVLFDDGALPVNEAVRVGAEVARALDAACRQGIHHRDVKPANIFLAKDGAVKLADFGLARSEAFTRTRLTDLNAVACTPAYAAPEQAEGKPTDHRSDIYSLGCVLYEMVTERPPFQGASPMETLYRHSKETPPSPRLLNPAVTPEFETIVMKCLSKKPDDRYATYGDLVRDLEAPAPAAVSSQMGLWSWAAAAGAALVGVILTAIFINVGHLPANEPEAILSLGASEPERVVRTPEPVPEAARPAEPPSEPRSPEEVPPRKPKPVPPPPKVAPAPEEVETVGRLLEQARLSFELRMGFHFDASVQRLAGFAEGEILTPRVRAYLEAEEERLGTAVRQLNAAKLHDATRERVVVARDGRLLEGRIISVDADEVTVELKTGFRETLSRRELSPATIVTEDLSDRERILLFAGAGNAASVVGELGKLDSKDREKHEVGIIDHAIEEAFQEAGEGRFRLLRELEISKEQRKAVAPYLQGRLGLFDAERVAAVLYETRAAEKRGLSRLLREFSTTFAGRRAAAEILSAFRDRCDALRENTPEGHADYSELVGVIPWATWRTDKSASPAGLSRLQVGSKDYLLEAPGSAARLWFVKKLKGARRGYSMEWHWRSGREDASAFVVALSPGRWIEFSEAAAVIYRLEEDKEGSGRPRIAKRVDFAEARTKWVCSVVPAESEILVYVQNALLFVLPEAEYALDEGIRLGVGGGAVVLKSVRVADRTRN